MKSQDVTQHADLSGELDGIIAYESGELDHEEMVALFQKLVNSGLAWRLQGSYGRMAHGLIEAGFVNLPVRGVPA